MIRRPSSHHPPQVEYRPHMRHAPLNRGCSRARAQRCEELETHQHHHFCFYLQPLRIVYYYYFWLYLIFSWSPLRTSCRTVFFWVGWSLPALPLWTRWPAPDCSSSGSSWHWSASVPPSPPLSWLSGSSRRREIRTTSMRACGRPAALTRKQSVNLTIPS